MVTPSASIDPVDLLENTKHVLENTQHDIDKYVKVWREERKKAADIEQSVTSAQELILSLGRKLERKRKSFKKMSKSFKKMKDLFEEI